MLSHETLTLSDFLTALTHLNNNVCLPTVKKEGRIRIGDEARMFYEIYLLEIRKLLV